MSFLRSETSEIFLSTPAFAGMTTLEAGMTTLFGLAIRLKELEKSFKDTKKGLHYK